VVTDEDDDHQLTSSSTPELTSSDLTQISPPAFPTTYIPMLEYPGTMRPGRTPENMPYHDLPNLGIDDPDPVPWPHFQEIEWHHHWDPPHVQALAMEDFIELQGRWASVEEEAEMRMGMRRGVRERREMEELASGKSGATTGSGAQGGAQQMVIMDDDEEDEEGEGENDGSDIVGLGEGVEALLKTAADMRGSEEAASASGSVADDDEDGSDDFLLDLGLGGDDETDETEAEETAGDDEDDLDLDFSLGLDDDEDDAEGDAEEDEEAIDNYDDDEEDITLDDFTKKEDGVGDGDGLDDGGFDYGE